MPAAISLVHADIAATVSASNRTEIRGRDTQGATPNPSLDVADTPTVRLAASDPWWNLSLGYSAVAIAPDLEIGLDPQLLQSADIGVIGTTAASGSD